MNPHHHAAAARQEALQLQARIRRELAQNGTNVAQNDADPFGDGDQSELRTTTERKIRPAMQQYHRELFAHGGDIAECSQAGMMSEFACACIAGNFQRVEELLKEADAAASSGNGKPSRELVQLLERRETSLRLSPLLLVVSAGKNVSIGGRNFASPLQQGQIQVA